MSNAARWKSLNIFENELSPMIISIAWPYTKLPENISNIYLKLSKLILIYGVDQQ